MKKIVRLIDRISTIFGVISGIFILLGMTIVLTEVVARFFNSTIYVSGEYTAYFMVAITFLGLAYTLKDRGHIRMVFLHKVIKSDRVRAIVEIYSCIVGLIVFTIITKVTFDFFLDSVATGTRSMQVSRTYLAIPQFAMPLGSLLITLQFIAEILRSIIQLKTGEVEKPTLEDEALGR